MSSLSADALVEYAKESFTENCCAAAAVALLIYDWAVTLGQEFRYVWRSSFRGYTALFFLNRINMLGMIVGILLGLVPWYSGEVCKAAVLVLASFQILNFFVWAVVSSLRVYAISNRNLWLSLLTFALAMVPFATNLYNYVESSYFISDFKVLVACEYTQNYSDSLGMKLLILTRVSVILADGLVLMVTWRHLRGTLKSSRIGTNRVSLGLLLLRDGTLYFLLLLLLNVAQIIAVLDFGQNFDPIPDFIFPITCIIISRFILNLRRFSSSTGDPLESHSWTSGPDDRPGHTSGVPRSYLSSIMFRSGTGRAVESERTVASINDGIMVKVSTFSDADVYRGEEDNDVEAMELERMAYRGQIDRQSFQPRSPSHQTQFYEPPDYGRVRREKGTAR
ncbi:uncharacterized protein C8Q71DRAFT_392556 [Rhodofomes roseus]|uniref:DUF6533 domain-containing protein n=1 Tax=Rhodofomes roseus TaxID=34475 RepID=A0ABQ8JZV1_9APHY|nr:uncharacterized protein C8Q71DRAFT_392556 [Rhodofomes roseus]KAH9829881.1 hypothetical protein C8Q71DRAFT_392556 [Rhodofomes roseus]